MRKSKLQYIIIIPTLFLTINLANANLITIQNDKIETPKIQTYEQLKISLENKFKNESAGKFGNNIPGINTHFQTDKKEIALTFDACIGKKNDYNFALINYLEKEKIPATLFITKSWSDANKSQVKMLASNELFDIQNHGEKHRVNSTTGKSVYKIKATKNTGEVIDEIELGAENITKIKDIRPTMFRPATSYLDEKSVKIANELNMKVVNFDILPGDAVPFTSAEVLSKNIIKNAHPGAIVIMHFNHPQWNEKQALEIAIPKLSAQGYKFVLLKNTTLVENK